MSEAGAAAWGRALLALDLLAADPGLGGIVLRARAGPVRDAARAAAEARLGPLARIAPGMDGDHLFGGLDLTATVAAGRPVRRTGLLEAAGGVLLSMAERTPPGLAARLGQAVEGGACVVALDEGCEDERVPAALAGRLAFEVGLDEVGLRDVVPVDATPRSAAVARLSDDDMRALAVAADALGVSDGRALGLAARCARAHAALAGRPDASPADLEAAAALVLAPRATRLPAGETPEAEAAPPEGGRAEADGGDADAGGGLPEDMLVEAARALLPPDLLARLAARRARAASGRSGAGTGDRRAGHRRGRPLPSRPGRPDGRARVDLVATLRRAAPWQRIRRDAEPGRTGPILRASDIMLRRAEEVADRLLVFVVDASGSAALARLAEAKGAVELLLGAAYARRDHVALVAFRGRGAETLLTPTRSLARTKRRLAGLAGGGGTPLAAGLREALVVAEVARRRGMTPSLVLLSDGRANVALDGEADRPRAAADAEALARAARAARLGGIVIDTGQRPSAALASLARALDGAYLPLPRAGAQAIRGAALAALEG